MQTTSSPALTARPHSGMRPLGQQLKELRQGRKLTLKAVSDSLKARGVDASTSSLSNWERGVAVPPADHLAALGAVYNTTFTVTAGRIRRLDQATADVVAHMLAFREERREQVADLITGTLSSMLEGLTRSELMGEPAIGTYELEELLGSLPEDGANLIAYDVDGDLKYPIFQFDLGEGGVHPVVADVNRLLKAETDPLGVLAWWLGPNARVDGQPSPKRLLRTGEHDTVRALAGALASDSG